MSNKMLSLFFDELLLPNSIATTWTTFSNQSTLVYYKFLCDLLNIVATYNYIEEFMRKKRVIWIDLQADVAADQLNRKKYLFKRIHRSSNVDLNYSAQRIGITNGDIIKLYDIGRDLIYRNDNNGRRGIINQQSIFLFKSTKNKRNTEIMVVDERIDRLRGK